MFSLSLDLNISIRFLLPAWKTAHCQKSCPADLRQEDEAPSFPPFICSCHSYQLARKMDLDIRKFVLQWLTIFQLSISAHALSEVQLQEEYATPIFWSVHDQNGWNQDEILQWCAHKRIPSSSVRLLKVKNMQNCFRNESGRAMLQKGRMILETWYFTASGYLNYFRPHKAVFKICNTICE